jgi:hypothetical protein
MKRLIALVLAAAGLLTALPALAWHYGPRVSLGFSYGGYWGPGPFWGPPWYPAYYYAPPAVIVTSPPQPVQYIERPVAPAPAPVQQQSQAANLTPGYWYFCENPRGYYPHVKECPVPWKAVAPVPPPNE